MEEIEKTVVEPIEFVRGSVPVSVAAKVCSKDMCWVRAGIITGYFPVLKKWTRSWDGYLIIFRPKNYTKKQDTMQQR